MKKKSIAGRVPLSYSPWLKRLLIMKMIVILLLVVGLTSSYAESDAQTAKLNLKLSGGTVKDVIEEIERQTNLSFMYDNNVFRVDRKISINAENETVKSVVEKLISGENLKYEMVNRYIVITSNEIPSAVQQQKSVSGKVTDSMGGRLPGVSVVVKGTTTGTITDANGNYTLSKVPENATLVFSFVGMKILEVAVGVKTNVNVKMEEEAIGIEEVVAVGYGTLRKIDLTGSVGKVLTEKSSEQTSSSVEQLLQGRTSGVDIIQTSGAPGAGILFNIRGTNSMGSNQPLIVIDGYPIESSNSAAQTKSGRDYWGGALPEGNALAMLNPNEIESVDILKDASSTAIYGSRGANGVVIITTKRGREGKDKLSYNYRTDISSIPKQIEMLSASEYIKFANEACLNSKQDSAFTASKIKLLEGLDSNWQDMLYRTAYSHDHQLAFTGGDKRTKYSITANYTNLAGIIKYSKYDKGGIRVNLDREFSSRFKMGVNFNANFSKNSAVLQSTNNSSISGSVVTGALRFSPLNIPYTLDGELDLSLQSNPVVSTENTSNISKNTAIIANLFAEYSINKDLKFRANGGINQTINFSNIYYGRGTYWGDTKQGGGYQGNSNYFNYLSEYTLQFNKKFNKHSINAVGGYTWQSWTSSSVGISVYEFPSDNLGANALQFGNQISTPNSYLSNWALASFLSRINYVYADKYLITLTGRMDGASRLAEGHKWDLFPSAALGWNIHKESFLINNNWISQLKLRASYGISGNQSVAVGATKAKLTINRAAFDVDKLVTGVIMDSFENPYLGWEHTSQLNTGFDMGLLKNKFNLTLDWYKKTTTDLLFNLPIPHDTGFGSYVTNEGEIENSGLNIDASMQLFSKELKWRLSGNIGFNRNKVISLGPNKFLSGLTALPGSSLNAPITIAQPGYTIGSFFGYKTLGIYQNSDEVTNGPADPLKPGPGDIKYADLSGPEGKPDGKITVDDRTILGNPDPKYSFGLTNSFNYKNFDLTIFIQGSIGQKVANLNRFFSDALVYATGGNQRVEAWEGRWTGEGTSNYYPKASSTRIMWDGRFSDYLVEDASFVRLKNIGLSYTFTKETVRFANNLKVFVNSTNLLTFTKYKGYDPEVSAFGGNAINRNIDYGTIPQMRTWSCGVNVTF